MLAHHSQQLQHGTAGCALPRAAVCHSDKQELNNSTKPWACGSCRGHETAGPAFPAEQPFGRGHTEAGFNMSVVYAQATAHKSHVTTPCVSTTSLPRIISSGRSAHSTIRREKGSNSQAQGSKPGQPLPAAGAEPSP